MIQNIQHPRKDCVPLAAGLAWGNDGAIYQEKLDGCFATAGFVGAAGRDVLAGESVRTATGDQFRAWDCLEFDGQDVRTWSVLDRLAMMGEICRARGVAVVQSSPDGGALLRDVLARGGEGIVRKMPGATYFDTMIACKRLQTWCCAVTGFAGGSQSVAVADAETGENRGRVALRGGKIDRVRIDSIIKVEGLGLHASGLIRDPRPCHDTENSWLVKF